MQNNNTHNPLYGGHNGQTVRDESAEAAKNETADLEDLFAADPKTIMAQIDVLAQHVATEDGACSDLDKELKDRKKKLDGAKEQLHTMLKEAGMASCKLECGLAPRATVKMQYYPVGGVSCVEFMAWLTGQELSIKDAVDVLYASDTLVNDYKFDFGLPGTRNVEQLSERWPELTGQFKEAGPDLGDIIKPTVNFNTAQSALKAYEEQGNDVPDSVVTKSAKLSVTMGGKSKYLAGKGVE